MSQMVFEPTVSVFEPAKAVHALDRSATVSGNLMFCDGEFPHRNWNRHSYSRATVGHQHVLERYSYDECLRDVKQIDLAQHSYYDEW
jgi:hypothetical protein